MSLNSDDQKSNKIEIDIFSEPTEGQGLYYRIALLAYLDSSLPTKEIFFFGGCVFNLWRLGLCEKPDFIVGWMPVWWNLYESGFRIREDTLDIIARKVNFPASLVASYLSKDFHGKEES